MDSGAADLKLDVAMSAFEEVTYQDKQIVLQDEHEEVRKGGQALRVLLELIELVEQDLCREQLHGDSVNAALVYCGISSGRVFRRIIISNHHRSYHVICKIHAF